MRRLLTLCSIVALLAASCGSGGDAAVEVEQGSPASDAAGIRLVSAQEGADIQQDPPEDLVILDVRTPEEFADGHLEGATTIDFYRDDFAEQLADLDPDVPYLLYCRSGNRSGQTAEMMRELGFADVADIDGGILSWTGANLPTVGG